MMNAHLFNKYKEKSQTVEFVSLGEQPNVVVSNGKTNGDNVPSTPLSEKKKKTVENKEGKDSTNPNKRRKVRKDQSVEDILLSNKKTRANAAFVPSTSK